MLLKGLATVVATAALAVEAKKICRSKTRTVISPTTASISDGLEPMSTASSDTSTSSTLSISITTTASGISSTATFTSGISEFTSSGTSSVASTSLTASISSATSGSLATSTSSDSTATSTASASRIDSSNPSSPITGTSDTSQTSTSATSTSSSSISSSTDTSSSATSQSTSSETSSGTATSATEPSTTSLSASSTLSTTTTSTSPSSTASPSSTCVNLIQDGGFEEAGAGRTTPWDHGDGGEYVTSPVNDGTYAFRGYTDTARFGFYLWATGLGVQSGQSYSLSVSAAAPLIPAGVTCKLSASITNGPGAGVDTEVMSFSTSTNSFTRREVILAAGADGLDLWLTTLCNEDAESRSEVVFDSISLRKVDDPECGVVETV